MAQNKKRWKIWYTKQDGYGGFTEIEAYTSQGAADMVMDDDQSIDCIDNVECIGEVHEVL